MSYEIELPGQKLWSHGSLNPMQTNVLTRYIKGKVVFDIGSGMLALTRTLVLLGAKHVHAVDPIYSNPVENMFNGLRPWDGGHSVTLHAKRVLDFNLDFKQQFGKSHVTFLSWPLNQPIPGLVWFVKNSEVVIYLGKNTDGTACGDSFLFDELKTRKVEAYEPHRDNVLAVYGEHLKKPRRMLPEERAQHNKKRVTTYEDAHKNWRRGPAHGKGTAAKK